MYLPFNLELFCNDLHIFLSENFCQPHISALDTQILTFYKSVSAILDEHAPMLRSSRKLTTKVFTNQAIVNARRTKRKAERRFKKSCLLCNKKRFNTAARNLLQQLKKTIILFTPISSKMQEMIQKLFIE